MWRNDRAAQALGMSIGAVEPGKAILSMPVRPDMCNGHSICHGGMIFTLADTAFAYACNSHNRVTVANNCTVTFVAPAQAGDNLTAVAEERHRGGHLRAARVAADAAHQHRGGVLPRTAELHQLQGLVGTVQARVQLVGVPVRGRHAVPVAVGLHY